MIKIRSKLFRSYCFLLLLVSSSNIASVDVKEIAANESMSVLNSFMDTFNSRYMQSWAQTLNYPHVRLAGGKVTVWNTQEEYAAEIESKRSP